MGIDPVRFLEEFVSVSFHVHGKDTEILGENLYEYGTLQTAVAPPSISFGETYWRYTIPGHGCARWGKLLGILANAGYGGRISIELEDMNFNGTEEGEKRGFIASRDFLVPLVTSDQLDPPWVNTLITYSTPCAAMTRNRFSFCGPTE